MSEFQEWKAILDHAKNYEGRSFMKRGIEWKFDGVVDSLEDYYWLLWNRERGHKLVSCVASLEQAGYQLA